MIDKIPLFMTNKAWYRREGWTVVLTPEGEAIPAVKASYDRFMAIDDAPER